MAGPFPKDRQQLLEAGVWLRARRKEVDLTQRTLATLVGLSYASISNYERGTAAPDDATAATLARLLSQPEQEVRRRFGLYVAEDHAGEQPHVSSVQEAVMCDAELDAEAKQVLLDLYRLLLRTTSKEGS